MVSAEVCFAVQKITFAMLKERFDAQIRKMRKYCDNSQNAWDLV
jgi:hypothetical protein